MIMDDLWILMMDWTMTSHFELGFDGVWFLLDSGHSGSFLKNWSRRHERQFFSPLERFFPCCQPVWPNVWLAVIGPSFTEIISIYPYITVYIYIHIIDIHLCCIWCHDAFVWFLWPLKLDAKVQTKLDEDDCGQKVMKLQNNFHKMALTRSRRTLCICYRKGEAIYLKVLSKKSVSDQHKLSPKLGNFPIDPSWKAGTTVKFL